MILLLRKKCIQKIFRTTICLFLLLVVSTISNLSNKISPVMLDIEDVTMAGNSYIYVMDKSGYLVKRPIYLQSEDLNENVLKIVFYLKNKNLMYSNGLLNEKLEVLSINFDEKYLTIDFSCDFYETEDLNSSVSSLIYSLMELDGVKGVTILVEGEYLKGYPKIINKDISIINPSFELTSRDDVSKVVIYYLLEDDGKYYYVPVTKYLNDNREKIDILVDQLSSNSSMELISVVNRDLELIDYREENDMLILNFNHALFDSNDKVLEEVLYCISYSVFDNYDVSMVLFEVDGKNVGNIEKNHL